MIIIAKSKWPYVKANLHLVEKWSRDGLTEKEIAKNLGISKSTMENYKAQHLDFLDSLKRGKQDLLCNLENALVKTALGYDYAEKKTYTKNKDGELTEYTETTVKHKSPDVAAIYILLKNKDKDEDGKSKWSNNPAKLELEREMAEHRKRMDEMNNF